MNSFGRLFRINIFGESHGPSVGIIIDGCPAGLQLSEGDFQNDLERRKGGIQKGTTPRKEDDKPIFISGFFKDKTTGAPLTIVFENNNIRSEDYEKQKAIYRPGHADFVAEKKFHGHQDFRGGGHFSGRLTVCLVAAGIIAKKLLKGISVTAEIIEVGGERDIDKGLQKAIEAKDSVGGIIECRVTGLPVGLGEPFFDSLESVIAHAVFSIPAIKGLEFGAGFKAANMFGSEHNDTLLDDTGKTKTNYAGGIIGGISNGNDLVYRVVVKPNSSTSKEQESWNAETKRVEKFSIKGRHDLCIALRVPPVLEAVTAICLVDAMMLQGFLPTTNLS
jgi:chorismate synthase